MNGTGHRFAVSGNSAVRLPSHHAPAGISGKLSVPYVKAGAALAVPHHSHNQKADEATMTTIIRQDDLIESVADALQLISYYHLQDFVQAVYEAYQKEESQAAKDAMAHILINSRMCAQGHRPICQDTGIVTAFVNIGMDVKFECDMALDDVINEGVRRAYTHPDNVLRASVLADPDGKRQNTKDNTPAIRSTRLNSSHVRISYAVFC